MNNQYLTPSVGKSTGIALGTLCALLLMGPLELDADAPKETPPGSFSASAVPLSYSLGAFTDAPVALWSNGRLLPPLETSVVVDGLRCFVGEAPELESPGFVSEAPDTESSPALGSSGGPAVQTESRAGPGTCLKALIKTWRDCVSDHKDVASCVLSGLDAVGACLDISDCVDECVANSRWLGGAVWCVLTKCGNSDELADLGAGKRNIRWLLRPDSRSALA